MPTISREVATGRRMKGRTDSRGTQLLLWLLFLSAMRWGGGDLRVILQRGGAVHDNLLIGLETALQDHHRALRGVDDHRLHDDRATSGSNPARRAIAANCALSPAFALVSPSIAAAGESEGAAGLTSHT